jgi:3'-phosphoadenosine 5'-phosphosulfate sulfotransferase (PAPS reductase)/FAD synthetase
LIDAVLSESVNPAVMCSFGKDSIAVLHLVRQHKKTKVVFHREPLQHHKYAYANRMMQEWDLHMVDFPPSGTAMNESEKETEVVNYYSIGRQTAYLPTGMRQTDAGKDTLCALNEIYGKPTGTFSYPFDYVFHGHKSVDSDPILGDVPLQADIAKNIGSASAAYPIRHFTNEDVWRYIEENNIPIHHERYEKIDGQWVERDDKTDNPDYISCCYSCMSKRTGNNVYCPKVGFYVSNVSSQLRWAPAMNLNYLNQN